MSVTAVCVVWITLSVVVAAAFWFSLLQPYWFINTSTMTSLGVYSYCSVDDGIGGRSVSTSGDESTSMTSSSAVATSIARLFAGSLTAKSAHDDELSAVICRVYGGRFQLTFMPSGPWQAACVLFTAGAVLMTLAAILAVGTLFVSRKNDTALATAIGYMQIVAGWSRILDIVSFRAWIARHFYTLHIRPRMALD
jgi:hypothetical protein